MMTDLKSDHGPQSPICDKCCGWMEEVRVVDGKLWYKCRVCGFMKKKIERLQREL